MPSTSPKQHRFMEMVAHDSAAAKRVGVPQSVGKDFAEADKGKSFADGGFINTGVTPPPTMGTSSAYPPPPGHRPQGPRNYRKRMP